MSQIEILLILLFLLQTKHLIVDWCWQPPFEFLNKGKYGHWGGVRHALKNAIGTGLCFLYFTTITNTILIIIIDFLLHYHIDYLKMNINRIKKWSPLADENFWRLMGLDQFCHQICYLGLILGFMV